MRHGSDACVEERRNAASLELLEEHRKNLEGANDTLRQEIRRREEAEAGLRQSEERFRVFMGHLPAAAFMKDAEGRLPYANRYLCDLFGWTDAEGQSTCDLLPKEILNLTNRYRCKDGSYRWIEWRSFPAGKRIYAAARDVTRRIQAEEELKRHRDHLEKLAGKGPGNCWRRRKLRETEKAAQRASELTRGLLMFSRKIESKMRPLDLNQEVRQVEKLLRRTCSG